MQQGSPVAVALRQAAARLLLQTPGVALHGLDVRQRVGHGLSDRLEERIGERRHAVVDPEAVPARLDQADAAQVGEMPRGLGLRDLEALMQVAHADLTGQEQAENPQARRVRQRFEEVRQGIERLDHIFVLTNISDRRLVLHIR